MKNIDDTEILFIFKGGNVLRTVVNEFKLFIPGNTNRILEDFYGDYFKRSDADFGILINPDIAKRAEIMKMISHLNYTLAIGAFILFPGEHFIFLKYNLGLVEDIDKDIDLKVTRSRWAIENHLKQYYQVFETLNNSNKKYEELL